MSKNPLWLLATASILVAGCGGGGGGGSDTPASVTPPPVTAPPVTTPPVTTPPVTTPPVTTPPVTTPPVSGDTGPTVPLEAAISSLYSTTRTFSRTETDPRNGDIYDVKADYVVGANTTFENVAVKTVNITRNIKKNGVQFSSSSQNDFFQASPYRLIGTTFPSSPVYVVASSQVALPVTAKPGDSGKFYDTLTYDSANKNLVLAGSSLSWAVTADTATTVTFCVNSINVVAQVPGATTRSDCYKIDTTGTVQSIGFSIPTSN